MMNKKLIAHKNKLAEQTLENHLQNVSILAGKFALSFNNSDWAELAGLWHDLGKADSDWQNYIRGLKSKSINHSEFGAQYSYLKFKDKYKGFEKVLPYIIAGHHAGLPDWYAGSGKSLKSILQKDINTNITNETELKEILNSKLPSSMPFGKNNLQNENPKDMLEHYHLWIRMLYSCLVDADYLDTEKFMIPEQSFLRSKYASLTELKNKFDFYMMKKTKNIHHSEINNIRADILQACRSKAVLSPGFFSLNVPTGGGKTLSSMAFALDHAMLYNKKRIIIAIPYTSIIEQTAKVYKYGTDDDIKIEEIKQNGECLFGEENVLEHHSNFDFDKNIESEVLQKQKLSTENWDAPIIVTTNVQLFESLFNAHSSNCRKLHNIVDSVIILDEVQMVPPEYLKSILSVLKGLVKCFGVTVVLCTATQPAFEGRIGSENAGFDGIPEKVITPIIENPKKLAASLQRVVLNTEYAHNNLTDWQIVADKLCSFEQVLCIVQTRKDCRKLHSLMPKGTIHLSALMCAEERSVVISIIKQRLRDNESIRVISTQLVECGVDIDFPVVFRAMAGMDSIAQAAGRCNREGKNKNLGTVFLFSSPSSTPPGLLRKSADATKDILEKYNYNIELSPKLYKEYFTKYFSSINNFDKPDFESTMEKERNESNFQFRTLSDNYHLIDSSYQGSVIIRYHSTLTEISDFALIDQLISEGPNKILMRKLGRYSVNLPLTDIQELCKTGRLIKPFNDMDIYVQSSDDETLYQSGLGLVADSVKSFSTYIF